MFKSSTVQLALAAITTLSLTACPAPKKSEDSGHNVERVGNTYFLNGDPRELIAGSELNTQSPFTKENLQRFEGFQLTTALVFVDKTRYASEEEKAKQAAKTSEELVRERKASETSRLDHAEKYEWKTTNNEVTLSPSAFLEERTSAWKYNALRFHFTPQADGRLELTAASAAVNKNDPVERAAIEVKHYSVHQSGNAFTILFFYQSESFQGLFFYQFTRRGPTTTYARNEALAPYTLVMGPKVDVHWEQTQPLNMEICGVTQSELLNGIKRGVEVWQQTLAGRLNITYTTKATCAPFSSLNSHTIRIVQKYKMMQVSGFALPLAGTPEQGIIDGDVHLLIDSELVSKLESLTPSQRATNAEKLKIVEDMIVTMTAHEMGHVLGLDHQYETESIMNYNWDYLKANPGAFLTSYDKNAITTLYRALTP